MKSIILLLSVLFLSDLMAAAAPRFSAFAVQNKLYVTVLEDSCNNILGASLKVHDSCKEGRMEKNIVSRCYAKLEYLKTKMMCHDLALFPRVIEIDLTVNNIAQEAETLRLSHMDQTIDVILSR